MEPNDEEELEPFEQDENENVNGNFKLKGAKGLGHKVKKGAKKAGKNAQKAFSASIKNIAKVILLKAKVIIIPVLAVLIATALIDYAVKAHPEETLTSGVTAYYDTYVDNSSSTTTSSKEMYDETGSLVLATSSEIKAISDSYMKNIEKKMPSFYNLIKTKDAIGDYRIADYDYADGFDISNAYEFMLSAEKMNFNRIIWKEITRDGEEKDLNLIQDDETNLKYPDNDEDDKDLEYFAKMTAPYLQSYIIPTSIISGVVTNTSDTYELANFAFQIIDKAYHRIQINQYTVQNVTRHKTEQQYVSENLKLLCYEKTELVPDGVDEETGETIYKSVTYYAYDISDFNSKLDELRKKYEASKVGVTFEKRDIALDSDFKDNIIEKDYIYSMVQASTIRAHMNLTYRHKIYNQTSVDNFIDFLTLAVVKEVDYSKYSLPSDRFGITDTTGWTRTADQVIYTEMGEDITKKYYWQDDLELADTTSRVYTVDDVNSYLDKGELAIPERHNYVYVAGEEAPELIEDEIEFEEILSTKETAYYEELVRANELNLIDIINADRNVYKNYIDDQERYSKNVGYARSKLKESYYLMKKYLSTLTTKLDYEATQDELNEKIQSVSLGIYGNGSSVDYSDLPAGSFGWPVPSNKVVSAIFGWSQWYGDTHNGIDVWAVNSSGTLTADISATGTVDIVAAQEGTVTRVYDSTSCVDNYNVNDGCGYGYGNHIYIQHDNGYMTRYAHLSPGSIVVKEGDEVVAGQYLAKMGSSGQSSGVHLHFEILSNGNRIDPLFFYNVKPYNYDVDYEKKVRGNITMANPYQVTTSKTNL